MIVLKKLILQKVVYFHTVEVRRSHVEERIIYDKKKYN